MRLRLSLIILSLVSLPFTLVSQTATRPFMAGLSANFFDYNGPLSGDFTQLKAYDPGIAFGAYGYISDAFNYSLNTTFAPEVIYPTTENTFVATSMLDLKAMVRWTILNPESFFVPYLGTGFGMNTASNNVRLYVPAALGFRLRFTENFGLQWESTWQQRIRTGHFQPASHMVGFVFALPATRPEPSIKDPEPRPTQPNLADRDGDGVPDRDDQCPDERGKHMYLGCPDPEKPPLPEGGNNEDLPPVDPDPDKYEENNNNSETDGQQSSAMVIPDVTFAPPGDELRVPASEATETELNNINRRLQNIFFENGSYELSEEATSVLDEAAAFLQQYPDVDIQVMGHTDDSGNERGNIVLSIQRAYKVKYYLVYQKGVKMSRISSDGYGSNEPLSNNQTEEGRSMNRRVEMQVVKRQSAPDSGSRGNK